jgi:phage-related protein
VITPSPKRLVWIAASRDEMRAMPPVIRRTFGLALFAVQCGETPPIAKPLKGFGGAGVLELVEDDRGGTYRAVYTVRYATAVYVLHVFQKKSKQGRETPHQVITLIKTRLKQAEAVHTATR